MCARPTGGGASFQRAREVDADAEWVGAFRIDEIEAGLNIDRMIGNTRRPWKSPKNTM
jgi:hypothetical protein